MFEEVNLIESSKKHKLFTELLMHYTKRHSKSLVQGPNVNVGKNFSVIESSLEYEYNKNNVLFRSRKNNNL